ncbi:hypothetical protein Tco_0533935 [Tanacetum coccineum]
MEGARVMIRGFGDLVAKLGDKVVMEVLVRCWSDGDVVVRSMGDEVVISVQNLRTFAISAITNSSDIESG